MRPPHKSGTGRWTSRDRSWKSDKERTAFRAILAGHAPSPWPPSCFGHRTSPRRRRRLSNPLSGLGAGLAAATLASWWCVGRAANCRPSTASPPVVDPSPLVSSSSSASPSLPLRVRILVFLIFLSRRFTGERWMLMLLLYLYCQRLLTFFLIPRYRSESREHLWQICQKVRTIFIFECWYVFSIAQTRVC